MPRPTVFGSVAIALLAAFALATFSTPARATPLFTLSITNPHANWMMYDVTIGPAGLGSGPTYSVTLTVGTGTVAGTSCPASIKKTATQTFNGTITFDEYNFVPGTAYYYKMVMKKGTTVLTTQCGALATAAHPTPALPPALDALIITQTVGPGHAGYVMFNTGDCGTWAVGGVAGTGREYIVVYDTDLADIVWYVDVTDFDHEIDGWRYQADGDGGYGSILAIFDRTFVTEWGMDGDVLNDFDIDSKQCDHAAATLIPPTPGALGPCYSHDAFHSFATGDTYVLASEYSATDWTGTDFAGCDVAGFSNATFVNDGFDVYSGDSLSGSTRLMSDSGSTDLGYDPLLMNEPFPPSVTPSDEACDAPYWNGRLSPDYTPIDWTHTNAIVASRLGTDEVVDISLRAWAQVVRYNVSTGDVVWSLSSGPATTPAPTLDLYSSVAAAPVNFYDQHDVHPSATNNNILYMFDNKGDPDGARVLRLQVNTGLGKATIDRAWVLVNGAGDRPLTDDCYVQGSGQEIPGVTNAVLATCMLQRFIEELTDYDGNNTLVSPALYIELPAADACSSGGAAIPANTIPGWTRAYPMQKVGLWPNN
jgi:hypothetical protein